MMREEVIGDCRLINADCRDVLPTLGKVDAVVTDPPYGIDYKSGHATNNLWVCGRTIAGDGDTLTRDAVIDWALYPDSKTPSGIPILCFGTWRATRPSMTKMVLIWDKGGALGMGDLSIPWKPDHEEIYVIGSGFCGSRDSGSVLRCPPVQSMAQNGRVHPTEKPVSLLMTLCRKVPGTILDPFMGSGTTGVACVKLGKSFIGIEREQKYFDIACRRIDEATKQGDLFVPRPSEKPQQLTMDVL